MTTSPISSADLAPIDPVDSAPHVPVVLPPLPPAPWPWQRSLQLRIVLSYALMFTIVLGLLTWRIGGIIYNNEIQQVEHELEIDAFLTANALEDAQSGFTGEFDDHNRYLNSILRGYESLYGTWVVGDHTFLVDASTRIEEDEGSFALGGCAEVKVYQTNDGAVATEVESSACDSDAAGLITSFPNSEIPIILDHHPLRPNVPAVPRLQQFVTSYASDTQTSVTILDPWGNVMADSHLPRMELPNQLHQIEIRAALQEGEHHDVRADLISGGPTLYVAAPINQNGRTLGLVRLSQPMDFVTAGSRTLLLALVLASLAALMITVGMGVLIGKHLVQPVQRLERAAIALGAGDLSQRVPVDRADELGALALAFNHMTGELARMFRQQRLFIANASHELRTPLANIELRSDALLRSNALSPDDDDPERTRAYLEAINSETKRLGRLASDLLNLASLEERGEARAGIPSPPAPVDVRPTLTDAWAAMQFRAGMAGLTMTHHGLDTLPPLPVQPEQLEIVVINLLENAIKYTPAGGRVDLSASAIDTLAAPDQPPHVRVQICVRDTGPGIPAADLPHIFESFYRVDKARSRQKSSQNGGQDHGSGAGRGGGLGLSITQALIETMGGTIRVESEAGAGTRFIVELDAGPVLSERRQVPGAGETQAG